MVAAKNISVLKAFGADPTLADLSEALSSFNLFDAIGATHKELWHSDFLAFLLDPSRNHSLGDEFTKRFLRRAVPELVALDSWENVLVRREHHYVDILVQDESKQVSVIIENKIWSPEAPGQLKWYWESISGENPKWDTYGVFLTPKGVSPTCDRYRPLSYSVVKEILEEVVGAMSGRINGAVKMTIEHYSAMLGRSIVNTSGPEALARELYFKHRDAIKLMDPARWKGWIKSHLEHLIRETSGIEPEASNLEYVRFRVDTWDIAEGLKAGTNNTTGKPLLYFTFYNFEDSLTLYLWISPDTLPEIRTHLRQFGDAEQPVPPFSKSGREGQYYHIYRLDFLTSSDYKTRADDELRAIINRKWRTFYDEDLPRMNDALRDREWFWKAPVS